MAELVEEERELVERELAIGALKNKISRVTETSRVLLDENTKLAEELGIQKDNLKVGRARAVQSDGEGQWVRAGRLAVPCRRRAAT